MDGDLVDGRTAGLKLSLKLYHAHELPLDHQHLITEASPSDFDVTSLPRCENKESASSFVWRDW
jgi:hypothetical protein